MDCALKYYFSAAEREAYQKSIHCQNVINYSFIIRHFMMNGNKPQGTGYQPVRQFICLPITQCTMPHQEYISTNPHSY